MGQGRRESAGREGKLSRGERGKGARENSMQCHKSQANEIQRKKKEKIGKKERIQCSKERINESDHAAKRICCLFCGLWQERQEVKIIVPSSAF